MRVNRYLVAVLVVGSVSSCQPSASPVGSELSPAAVAPQQRESLPVGIAMNSQISKGMSYADLRKIVVQSGWKPVVDSDCKSNVMGSNHEELCKSNASELCKVCDDLPEVSGCSGDGYCGMYFSNGEQQLHVVTFGMIEDWNVSGSTSRLNVDGWDFSKTDASAKHQ